MLVGTWDTLVCVWQYDLIPDETRGRQALKASTVKSKSMMVHYTPTTNIFLQSICWMWCSTPIGTEKWGNVFCEYLGFLLSREALWKALATTFRSLGRRKGWVQPQSDALGQVHIKESFVVHTHDAFWHSPKRAHIQVGTSCQEKLF